MKIVIIGDGKVGFKLAKELSEDEYDVTLIDENEGKLKKAGDVLDVKCIVGNGISIDVQKEAEVDKADLTIACTSQDEINMLSCLVAKKIGAKNTIARVRSPLYFDQMELLREDLQLTMYVNPEKETARAMSRLIMYPDANNIEEFGRGAVEILDYTVSNDSPLKGMTLSQMSTQYGNEQLVVAVENQDEVFIPNGTYEIKTNDKLYFVFNRTEVDNFFEKLGRKSTQMNKVFICGGSSIAYYLASELCASGKDVKIIERDYEKCKRLADMLPKATIINGDVSNNSLLVEEKIGDADVFLGLTDIDEKNMISGLFAKQANVDKVIIKVNADGRAKMMKSLGIESVISAKTITANVILSYVKARQKSLTSEKIEAVYDLADGKFRAYEFSISDDTKYTARALKELSIKEGCLIACIIRNGKPIIPDGDTQLMKDDAVIIVTNSNKLSKIEDILK